VNVVDNLTTIFYRIDCESITIAAKAVWENPETADDVAQNALHILDLAPRTNLRFFSGKTPKCLLGGLFHLLGFRFNSIKSQKEIADFPCTTEVSISNSYRQWMNEFPQLFNDIKTFKLSIPQATVKFLKLL
jgi:hypothetical protein